MVVLMFGGVLTGGKLSELFLGAAALIGPLGALYVGLVRYAPSEKSSAALGLTRPRGPEPVLILLAVVVGAGLAPLAADVTARVLHEFPLDKAATSDDETAMIPPTLMVTQVIVLVQVFLSPLVDELFFRGFVQRRLARTIGRRQAWAVALALYVVAQLDPHFMPAALIVGAPLGVMVYLSGGSWVLVAAHVAHEATPLVCDALGWHLPRLGDEHTTFLAPEILAGSVAVSLAALALMVRVRSSSSPGPSPGP